MKTKSVTVTMGRTVTKNYQSLRLEMSETVELEAGDTPKEASDQLIKRLGDEITQNLADLSASFIH